MKQNFNINKVIFLALIIALVGINIFAMYTNVERQNEINSLKSEINQNIFRLNLLKDGEVKHSGVVRNESRLSKLFVFIPQSSCGSCLDYEIPNLNEFYESYGERTEVYLVGNQTSVLENYGAEFDYKIIDPSENIFNYNLTFLNPIIVLVNGNNEMIYLYLSDVNGEEKSNSFYNKMDILFTEFKKSSA